jgi:hypothetical protein
LTVPPDALQYAAWEKQNKEIERQNDLIKRLSGGAQSGRAAQAEKVRGGGAGG